MSEQEIEAEAERLHKIGAATVQRMREAHGMTHKFPTGAEAYSQEAEQEQVQIIVQFLPPWYDPFMYERQKRGKRKGEAR